MTPERVLVVWTVRAAALCYLAALALLPERERAARVWWTVGLGLFLIHVAAAFHFSYQWSHSVALRETARQTRELFGVENGNGLWLNYGFSLVWTADCLWWRVPRPRWVTVALHAFMAFMFFNGVFVFASGPFRWIWLALALWVAARWQWARRLR